MGIGRLLSPLAVAVSWAALVGGYFWFSFSAISRAEGGPAPSPAAAALGHEIEAAQAKWQALHIARYRIEVRTEGRDGHAAYVQTQLIVVENGRVVDHSARCLPAPSQQGECTVRPFHADDYAVAGLFARVQSLAAEGHESYVQVTFDPTYGFPASVAYDDPRTTGEESHWQVTAFETLH